jgi:hypothetical protein
MSQQKAHYLSYDHITIQTLVEALGISFDTNLLTTKNRDYLM